MQYVELYVRLLSVSSPGHKHGAVADHQPCSVPGIEEELYKHIWGICGAQPHSTEICANSLTTSNVQTSGTGINPNVFPDTHCCLVAKLCLNLL